MNDPLASTYQFLYENAGPIIRNEAAIALQLDTLDTHAAMVNHPDVQYWLACLHQFTQKLQIHGSADTCFENPMYKLLSFGVREADDARLKEVSAYAIRLMEQNKGNMRFYDTITPTIAASWLACMGHEEQIVIDVLRQRVEAVYSFTKDRNYDIYVSPEGYPTIPSARAVHPLVNPLLYEGNVWKLPSVHDVFAYAHLPRTLQNDTSIQAMVETIIEYILDERYQRFHFGYGLMLVRPNKYYGMGWSVHLDHYFEANNSLSMDGVVWAMELMSHFKSARISGWFKNTLEHLEGFCLNGIYEFPPHYIFEGKSKYYVGGGHMGLGEDRKVKLSRKLESTAWMMRILKNCIAQ